MSRVLLLTGKPGPLRYTYRSCCIPGNCELWNCEHCQVFRQRHVRVHGLDERNAVPDRMLSSEADRTITFGSDSFRNDPLTGLNVGVSRGATSFHDGTSMPQARPGCLSETHTIYIVYDTDGYRVDHKTNTLVEVKKDDVVKIELVSSSAIIGVAGAGHLAMGYPSTSTFTQATSPEETTVCAHGLGACSVVPDVFLRCNFALTSALTWRAPKVCLCCRTSLSMASSGLTMNSPVIFLREPSKAPARCTRVERLTLRSSK